MTFAKNQTWVLQPQFMTFAVSDLSFVWSRTKSGDTLPSERLRHGHALATALATLRE